MWEARRARAVGRVERHMRGGTEGNILSVVKRWQVQYVARLAACSRTVWNGEKRPAQSR